MAFWGDYHTHTVYSHGEGTVEENVIAAIKAGMKEIAITDHGFRHMTYNVRKLDWPFIRQDVERMKKKYPMITIYLGIESNHISHKGDIDMLPSDMDKLDIVVCAYHKFIMSSSPAAFFKYHVPNIVLDTTGRTSRKQTVRNTDAYIKTIEKYDIDIIAHMNYALTMDVVEVARACKHFGTYVELNGKRINMTDRELEKITELGAMFICDSDAHKISRVGDLSRGYEAIKRVGIPFEQVANWEKLPVFRSHKSRKIFREKTVKPTGGTV